MRYLYHQGKALVGLLLQVLGVGIGLVAVLRHHGKDLLPCLGADAGVMGSFFWFRKQLEYKCSDKGIQLIVADRFYPSSKLCSCCGNIKEDLKLSDRVYRLSLIHILVSNSFSREATWALTVGWVRKRWRAASEKLL